MTLGNYRYSTQPKGNPPEVAAGADGSTSLARAERLADSICQYLKLPIGESAWRQIVIEGKHALEKATEDSARLDALDYDANGNSIGYICVHVGNTPLFAPQSGRRVREVIDEARRSNDQAET